MQIVRSDATIAALGTRENGGDAGKRPWHRAALGALPTGRFGTLTAPAEAMQVPLQITFRGIDHSDSVEAMIRERAGRLERFHRDIIRCHVTVDQPHRHRSTGRAFSVHIDITTPGGSVVLTRDPGDRDHEQFSVVVRDAFDAATRQLEEEARRRRGD